MDKEKYLETYYIKNNKIYKCVGLITDPAIILENMITKEQEIHVIDSLNYCEFTRLI